MYNTVGNVAGILMPLVTAAFLRPGGLGWGGLWWVSAGMGVLAAGAFQAYGYTHIIADELYAV